MFALIHYRVISDSWLVDGNGQWRKFLILAYVSASNESLWFKIDLLYLDLQLIQHSYSCIVSLADVPAQ